MDFYVRMCHNCTMRVLSPQVVQTNLEFEQECAACGENLAVSLSDLRRDGDWRVVTSVWFTCPTCDEVQYAYEARFNKGTFEAIPAESPP